MEQVAITEDMLPSLFTTLEIVDGIDCKHEVGLCSGVKILTDDSTRHLHNALTLTFQEADARFDGEGLWNQATSSHEDVTVRPDWRTVEAYTAALSRG